MITREKVKEYIWAGGDIDGYARSGRHSNITDADWFLIDQTVSAIGMIRRGQAAPVFKQRHQEEIRETFDSTGTYELLVDYEAKSEQGGLSQ